MRETFMRKLSRRRGSLDGLLDGSFGGVLDFRLHEATASGVEVEELGVAAPVDGGFELTLRLFLGELLIEQVEEEVLGHCVVALGIERAGDLTQ